MMCEALRHAGCDEAVLHVQCINNAAVSFYTRNHFEIRERLVNHYLIDGHEYDAFHMFKPLQPSPLSATILQRQQPSICSQLFGFLWGGSSLSASASNQIDLTKISFDITSRSTSEPSHSCDDADYRVPSDATLDDTVLQDDAVHASTTIL